MTDRSDRIERIAALLYGAHPATGKPFPGWRSRLATDMGISPQAVAKAVKDLRTIGGGFDRRLADLVIHKMRERHAELQELERLGIELAQSLTQVNDTDEDDLDSGPKPG